MEPSESDGYAKHFIPLESDPDIFNELLLHLGVSPKLTFQEIITLDEPELLPRPAVAVIVLFSAGDSYDPTVNHPCTTSPPPHGQGGQTVPGDIIWFKQTIHNACGFYALLHAVANCHVENAFEPGSTISHLVGDSSRLPPLNRSGVLEKSNSLEEAYNKVAQKGQTSAPEDPEDEVEFHYICVARSRVDGQLYALDGDLDGPVSSGLQLAPGEDMLSERCVAYFKELIGGVIAKQGDSVNFNLMALVEGSV